MAKNGFRVLDSDIHIIEPPDLWERYIDAPFRHQAPRGFADWVLDLRIEIDGKLMPANVNYAADARGRSAQRDRERFRPFHERGWSPEAQLDAMDQEGIDVGVVYPTRGLFAQGIDGMEPKLAAAIARAYNNWLYDFCALNPQRLIGAGMISPFDIDDAVAEARRSVRELGFKGIFLRPNPVNGRNWHDEYYKGQCFVSVECDEEPITGVFDLMGVANIVFSTDFPHPDCKYPGAVARFLELPLPDAAKRAILWDNCARYYGLA